MTRRLGQLACLVALGGCRDVHVLDGDAASSTSTGSSSAAMTTAGGASATSTTTGGASATSTSSSGATGGGGAEPEPRVVTLEYRGNGDAPIDDGRMLLSEADGTLVADFMPSALPVDVEVRDGQLVSFLRDSGSSGSSPSLRLDSFRVSPNVTTKIVGGQAPYTAPCDVEPMTVTVDFAEVPGATWYKLYASGYIGSHGAAPAPSVMVQVTTCEATFDLLAAARGGYQFLAHELFEGLPFVSGGTLSLSTSASSTVRVPLDVTIEGLEGASSLRAYAFWWPAQMSYEAETAMILPTPPSSVPWSPAPIFPGAPGYGWTALMVEATLASDPLGGCGSTATVGVTEPAPGTATQTIDVDHGLARVEALEPTGWTFMTSGELGDRVWVTMNLGGVGGPLWFHQEDPSFATAAPTFPELPADLAPPLVPASTTPTPSGVWHEDREDLYGYGDVVLGLGQELSSWRATHRTAGCD